MRPSGPVAVGAGDTVRFRPGALHVMLEELRRPLGEGDTVSVTLRFARAGAVEARALVVGYAELEDVLGGPFHPGRRAPS